MELRRRIVPVVSLEQHGHAGAAETAIVPAIDDGLVQTDELEPGREGEIATARLLSERCRALTDDGVGDPTVATAEAGETILQRVAERYVEQLEAERDAI